MAEMDDLQLVNKMEAERRKTRDMLMNSMKENIKRRLNETLASAQQLSFNAFLRVAKYLPLQRLAASQRRQSTQTDI